MSAAQVHIAGVDVQVGSRLRQRCSWCGATLVDYDLTRLSRPLEPGEDADNPEPWKPATWPVGELVLVHGHYSHTVPHEDGAQLPENACASMDHEVTR